MRDLVVHAWTSLDGISCDEGTEMYRVMGEVDDPVGDDLFARRLANAGTHIMGRVTYLEMADFWPTSSGVNAVPMNGIPKVVFSRTLRTAAWPQTRIASGDTAREIARLKAEPGGEIIAHGGTRFVRSLTQLDLVDRYRFYVLPFAEGRGVPLFSPGAHPGRMRLEQSTAYPSGILELVYAPEPPAPGRAGRADAGDAARRAAPAPRGGAFSGPNPLTRLETALLALDPQVQRAPAIDDETRQRVFRHIADDLSQPHNLARIHQPAHLEDWLAGSPQVERS